MSPNTSETNTTPTQLRAGFGQNLRLLCQGHSTISSICRELEINRYLSGESFPRPDVLHKICSFFKTDARILLKPLDQIEAKNTNALIHPKMRAYFGPKETDISLEVFPTGFFRFSRQSFLEEERFVQGLIYIYKRDSQRFLRGMEAKETVAGQGLDTNTKTREFRGFIIA
ncbi:MAG: XRE family transcriptional regulator, partial [Marinovum sp.]|nr:XRE family transcriptional regulator [Marinovum sp.]